MESGRVGQPERTSSGHCLSLPASLKAVLSDTLRIAYAHHAERLFTNSSTSPEISEWNLGTGSSRDIQPRTQVEALASTPACFLLGISKSTSGLAV